MAKSCTQSFSKNMEQQKKSVLFVALNPYTHVLQVSLVLAKHDGSSTKKFSTLLTQTSAQCRRQHTKHPSSKPLLNA